MPKIYQNLLPADPLLGKGEFLTQAEAMRILRQGIFKDAYKEGWLKEAFVKKGKKRARGTVFYKTSDVALVLERLRAGEYPNKAE